MKYNLLQRSVLYTRGEDEPALYTPLCTPCSCAVCIVIDFAFTFTFAITVATMACTHPIPYRHQFIHTHSHTLHTHLSIHQSLQEIVKSAVSLAPESDRIALYQSVVLAGGATKMPGLAQRLQHELLGVVPDGTRVTVVAPAERQWSAWCGASRLGARPSFQEYWVPKQLYEEIHYIFSVAKYVH